MTHHSRPVLSQAILPAKQKTLKSAISCSGTALHSGVKVTMTLRPAPIGTGIVFRRVDIAGQGALIAALWSNVSDTRLNTCISNAQGIAVHTIEHLMSALAAAAIDNLYIDITGPEVPVMDGSAQPFFFLLECAGVVEQEAPRRAIRVLEPIVVEEGGKTAALIPADDFSLDVEIDFSSAAIQRQHCQLALSADIFKTEISRARTFGFEHEVHQMRAAGLARGGSLENAVVISGDKVLNDEGLRYEDEFVRHKTLDAIGDLYLAGAPLLARFQGVRSGHALNNLLLRRLFATESAWRWAEIDDRGKALIPLLADDLYVSRAAVGV